MFILFILGLLIGAVVVIFSLQNTEIISVAFLGYQIQSSLAFILLLTLFLGMIISLLFTLPKSISNYFKNRSLVIENKKLKKDLEDQKEKTFFANRPSATQSELEKIELGAIENKDSNAI